MVAVTGDDDAQVMLPLGASWVGARAAGRPPLWFQGGGWDRLLAGRVGRLLARESAGWVGSGQVAGLLPGGLR